MKKQISSVTELVKAKKLLVFSPRHKYLDGVLDDAVWLITSEIEKREQFQEGSLLPRDIILKISLMSSKSRIPISIRKMVRFGEAYSKHMLFSYDSGTSDMGLPTWYSSDPNEYWEKEATVDYFRTRGQGIRIN